MVIVWYLGSVIKSFDKREPCAEGSAPFKSSRNTIEIKRIG